MRNIFVFGSNLAGRHGKGAALYARRWHGAIYGQGEGLQGDSYALPTKDEKIKTLPLDVIQRHIDNFLIHAEGNPDNLYLVTPIGCGLAGYPKRKIAPLFKKPSLPGNIVFTKEWFEDYNEVNTFGS